MGRATEAAAKPRKRIARKPSKVVDMVDEVQDSSTEAILEKPAEAA